MIEHCTLHLADLYNGAQVGDGLQKSKHSAIETRVQRDEYAAAGFVSLPYEGCTRLVTKRVKSVFNEAIEVVF